jgi:hypothetical protein
MINRLNNNKHLVILAIAVLLFFVGLGFAQPAHAWDLFSLADITEDFFIGALNIFVAWVFTPFMGFFSDALQWAIALSTTAITDNDQIKLLWGLIRDLVNMVFILALLVIAFGTIFDTAYGAKNTLFKLIIAALLINFSYVIGAIVIEFSNITASAFLGTIGNHADVSNRIAQSIQPGSFYPDTTLVGELTQAQAAVETGGRVLASLVFGLIFMALTIIALAVGFLLILIRVPILWTILIFSPFAFAAYILPQTQKGWNMWWKKLIEWSFVLPVYMFFVFLGVWFMNNAVLTPEQTKILESFSLTDIFLNKMSESIGRLFQFALSIFFLLGGAFAAKRVCGEAGEYTGKIQSWVTGRVKSGAAGTAVGTAWKQFKETGQIGKYQTAYGGERARRLRQARGRDIFEPGAYAQQRAKEVENQANALKARRATMTDEAWKKEVANAQKGGGVNAVAMKQLLAEDGMTVDQNGQMVQAGADDMIKYIQQAGGEGTPLAEKYLAAMHKSGALGRIDTTEAKNIVTGDNTEAKDMLKFRQMLGKALIKRDPASALDVSGPMLKILPSGESREEFLKSVEWGRTMSSVKSANKQKGLAQVETIQALKGELDEKDFEELEKNIKSHNPALWAEAAGEDVETELTKRMATDTPGEMRKYIKNIEQTNATELVPVLKNMDENDFKTLTRGQSREFRETLQRMRDRL